ncbi:SDR family oxidoreductase [Bradyrhizobium daqingense]|uniref:NAD(P)-dependent dehydrogenase (Short-subunit alcohol dehydrogenase family) n=1 Tax=Bradyrhizobium daqingense TaxID=993502 RepID=A0A562LQI6_9BRAD|nr:SDR family oxidoreductase [Bradyrhizobium daqingense]TWI09887.1 NAD(P)-dependent dehydrogenase (short-subunit alcohol dehydrogenase family) [Bradyrhizobium daqingense]UFS88203.1 SDR family oxidoreductase [Bradyrhizobium daqingense]
MTTSFKALFDLKGRTAVVTGGCGILGRRFADGLAEFGADVAIVDLDQAATDTAASDVASRHAVRAKGYACDITNPDTIRNTADAIEADLGPVSILLNNAASKTSDIDAFFAPVEKFSQETWREIMAVNLDGMFNVAQVFGGRMAERGYGAIVQTASIYGLMAPDQRIYEGSEYLGRAINTPAVYTASKAGVIGLTKHLATYWAAKGVRVNTLTPGGVESGQNETFKQRYGARIPLGRMARADEMVGTMLLLVSDAASYVTGQNIAVDGGLSAW